MIHPSRDYKGFHPSILREYDIRGQVGAYLNEQDAYILGRSFAVYLHQTLGADKTKTVCIGRDGRLSSPSFYEKLCDGLVSSGIHVIRIGVGSSPMLYFSVIHLNADAGIMVTGSHNPIDHNGFKLTLGKAPVFGKAIQEIGKIASDARFIEAKGQIEEHDIQDSYIDRLLHDLTITKDFKIAWDAGNGAAGELMRRLTLKMRGQHFLLYNEIDGHFPNHHPDPTIDSNLRDLQNTILQNTCDLGFALDGDGDRIGVVDEKGGIIRCDTLLAIYARDVLKNHPNADIIGDIKCSQILYDEIERLGGRPIMWKTGHSLIKSKMIELKAPLAGELSGHIFFADRYYGFDDALYCAIRLLNELCAQNKSLSQIIGTLPKTYNTPEIRFEVDEAKKFDLVADIARDLQNENIQNINICNIDGVRVTTPEGWWLIRASNTQNVLVARMESTTQSGLEKMIEMASGRILKIGYTLPTI